MKKWKVSANELPSGDYIVEADTPEQAVEQAKELWCEEADQLPWSVEPQTD